MRKFIIDDQDLIKWFSDERAERVFISTEKLDDTDMEDYRMIGVADAEYFRREYDWEKVIEFGSNNITTESELSFRDYKAQDWNDIRKQYTESTVSKIDYKDVTMALIEMKSKEGKYDYTYPCAFIKENLNR